MSKHILIAVDGSPAANAALMEAIAMAKNDAAELRLVHVVDVTAVAWGERNVSRRRLALSRLAESGEKVLCDALTMIRAAGLTASCARLRRERNVETVSSLIAAEAKDWVADLIIIGSPGDSPIRRALHGGLHVAVMRNARIPVLPVKAGARPRANRLPVGTPGRLGLA